MEFLLALLMYLGLIPSPQTVDAAPGLLSETAPADGTPPPDDSARPRTCGKNCTF